MNIYKLYSLTKKKEFCEWWYHPENIGGRLIKQRLTNMFNKMIK